MSIDSIENIQRFVENRGNIPLMAEMLEKSLVSSVNVRCRGWGNQTALMYQARYGTIKGMEFLMASKPPALVNLQNRYGNTALHYAVGSKDPAKLRFLLDHGADKTIRNDGGETALELARRIYYYIYCPKEIIEVLESYTPKLRG